MGLAQWDHPAPAVSHDDRALARRVGPPQREAQVADQAQALRIPELGAVPVFVLDDATPQRDGAEHRRVARLAKAIGIADGMQPTRALDVRNPVRAVARTAAGSGASGRPRPA